MALIAHYKLDGDATDSVGSNHGVGNVTSVGGKIGTAVNMTSNGTLTFDTSISKNYTISFWVKLKSEFNGNYRKFFQKSSNRSPGFWFHSSSNRLHLRQVTSNNGNSGSDTSTSLTVDEWYHVAFSCNDKGDDSIRFETYLNGVLDSSYNQTGTVIATGDTISLLQQDCDIDDVRIYDHALSQKEVQELAKAKVLHYTFNDFQEPTENLVASASLGSYAPYHNISGNADVVSMTWATTNAYITIGGFGTLQGKTLTVSGTMKKNGIPYLPSFGRVSTYQANNAIIHVRNTNTGRFEITQSYNSTSGWLFHTGFTANPGDVVTIEDFQVEEKDHATPFVNGTRTGVIQDSSGQGNDAALSLATTPKWVDDSKLGTGAYDFEPAKYINTGLPIRSYNCSSTDSKNTISCWVKLKANPSGDATLVGGAYYSGFALAVNTSGQIRGYYRNSTSSYNTSSYTLTKNVWFHVAVVQDLSVNKLRLYVNGVKTAETSVTNSNFGQETMFFQINRYQQTGGNTFGTCNVDLDDVIWYASALTDDQVLELYQTRASLDDQGNLLC
jgi:hypothetical protein